jgi:hypothetical protein
LKSLRAILLAVTLLVGVISAPSASAAEIETCVSNEGAKTDCWNKARWRYEFCYDRPPKRVFLQRYATGNWRLVKEQKLTRNTGCPPDYPYELKASRKMKKDGVTRFRWVLQYGSVYEDLYDNFTVSRTSQ